MTRSLIVEADGGSRGNPGVAGYGALVRDRVSGEVLAERAAALGKKSNNVAEYTGLIEGLQAVVDHEPNATVTVRMDSKLVIEQMAGRWKIKHEDMKRLAAQAQKLVGQIRHAGGAVTFEWIPREKNKAADKLSNEGMDGLSVRRDAWGSQRNTADEDEGDADPGSGDADATAAPSLPKTQEGASLKRPTRVILVRHGVTDFTERGLLDGRGGADPGLSEVGKRQAVAAARGIVPLMPGGADEVTVIASSLRRAQETARPIAEALGVTTLVEEAWDEQAFGEWDGLSFREIFERDADGLAALRTQPDHRVPGGESRNELDVRVNEAFDAALAHSGTIIVVTHRIVIMSVLARVLGLDMAGGWRLAAAPASFTGLEVWPDGNASVAFLNDTHHLR